MSNGLLRITAIIVAVSVLALGFAAVASYATTNMVWDGGFPCAEIRIDVRNQEGEPIPSARLIVYSAGTRQLAVGYPFANQRTSADLISDAEGQIVAVQERDGLQFGGECCKLFWFIPMGECSGPRFDSELSAPGYQTAKLDIWRLFDSPYQMYEDFPKTTRLINGEERTLIVIEQKFVLLRDSTP